MQLNKEKAEFLLKTIDEWQSQQLLSDEQALKLKQDITIRKFDWKQVTVYAFIIAVACAVLSVIVQFVMIQETSPLCMPPPSLSALLPVIVQFIIISSDVGT